MSGKPKRKRPWRCIHCGDRFAKKQYDGPGAPHWTVYDPREWEQEDENDA